MARKFYRTLIQVEILADYPYAEDDLRTIRFDVERGDVVLGEINPLPPEEVSGAAMASLLIESGETPAVLGLNDDGVDVGYDDEED